MAVNMAEATTVLARAAVKPLREGQNVTIILRKIGWVGGLPVVWS